jgi:hypothetical protein
MKWVSLLHAQIERAQHIHTFQHFVSLKMQNEATLNFLKGGCSADTQHNFIKRKLKTKDSGRNVDSFSRFPFFFHVRQTENTFK